MGIVIADKLKNDSMKQFTIAFYFEGQFYTADVTEIGGLDDTQYAISQRDEKLAERFKTNVIRQLKNEQDYQYGIPEGHNGADFMESLAAGLRKAVHK